MEMQISELNIFFQKYRIKSWIKKDIRHKIALVSAVALIVNYRIDNFSGFFRVDDLSHVIVIISNIT